MSEIDAGPQAAPPNNDVALKQLGARFGANILDMRARELTTASDVLLAATHGISPAPSSPKGSGPELGAPADELAVLVAAVTHFFDRSGHAEDGGRVACAGALYLSEIVDAALLAIASQVTQRSPGDEVASPPAPDPEPAEGAQ